MLIGAVHGYRGLIRELIARIEARTCTPRRLPVVATGGYAELIAAKLPEITAVEPLLTLEGLRLVWERIIHAWRRLQRDIGDGRRCCRRSRTPNLKLET